MSTETTPTAEEQSLRINTQADSWVSEKFPGAIRIGRDAPPFAFGEDIAAVHPTLPDEAKKIVERYNDYNQLKEQLAYAAQQTEALRTEFHSNLKRLNACRNRMANAFNMFAASKSDTDRQSAACDFWAADQDFVLNVRDDFASAETELDRVKRDRDRWQESYCKDIESLRLQLAACRAALEATRPLVKCYATIRPDGAYTEVLDQIEKALS